MNEFLGKPVRYWVELEKRAQELAKADLLSEIVELMGKIAFYESRIKEMSTRYESK